MRVNKWLYNRAYLQDISEKNVEIYNEINLYAKHCRFENNSGQYWEL